MEVSSSQQMHVFLLCLISGIACALFFDVQRSLRKISTAGKVRTAVEDIIFVIICTVIAIAVGFVFNKGQIRYYQIMGLVSGALFYAAFLSRIAMKALKKTYAAINKVIIVPVIAMVKIIILPFKKIYPVLKHVFSKIKIKIMHILRMLKCRKKLLKKRMKML